MGNAANTTAARPRALAIGDDAGFRRRLGRLLAAARIDLVEAAADGGLRTFYEERPDLVVLDLERVEAEGQRLLARIRELSDLPVVVVAGGAGEAERTRLLRAGADDCVAKPAGPELVARIEALLRRPRGEEPPSAVLGDEYIVVDRLRHTVEARGEPVELTPTEFRMLACFAARPGRVLGHGQLLDLVWGDRIRHRDEVKLYVSYLRRKLGAAGVDPVETVRGVGYRYAPRPAIASGSHTGS